MLNLFGRDRHFRLTKQKIPLFYLTDNGKGCSFPWRTKVLHTYVCKSRKRIKSIHILYAVIMLCITLEDFYLSKSEIKNIKGCEHYTDEEAEMIASFLGLYAQIIYQELNKNYENR